jgi:hypothetical protein
LASSFNLYLVCCLCSLYTTYLITLTTGGWWHLNWGERAHSNGWRGIGGMVLNTSNTWFPGVWWHSIRSLLAILPSAASWQFDINKIYGNVTRAQEKCIVHLKYMPE